MTDRVLLCGYRSKIRVVDLCPFTVHKSAYSECVFFAGLGVGNAEAVLAELGKKLELTVNIFVNSVLCCARDLVPSDRDAVLVCGKLYSGFVVNLHGDPVRIVRIRLFAIDRMLYHKVQCNIVNTGNRVYTGRFECTGLCELTSILVILEDAEVSACGYIILPVAGCDHLCG